VQMFMFNFGMWQTGSHQELCNFFHVSIYKVVTVHSDFLSIQAAVQLLIGLCIIILETVVFWVFVLTFLFYSLYSIIICIEIFRRNVCMPVSCVVLLPNNIRLHLMLSEHS